MNFFISFAEDARREVEGKVSIMGLLGDTVASKDLPINLPKLAIIFQGAWENRDFEEIALKVQGPSEGDNVTSVLKFTDGKGENAFILPVVGSGILLDEGDKITASIEVDGRELVRRSFSAKKIVKKVAKPKKAKAS